MTLTPEDYNVDPENAEIGFQQMFDAMPDHSVVTLMPGKIYKFNSLATCKDKSATVNAHGATIMPKPGSGYVCISFVSETVPVDYVRWYGGTFDGDKDNHNWPGSPTGDDTWDPNNPGNHGIVTMRKVGLAQWRDIFIKNNVAEGISSSNCDNVFVNEIIGRNAAPLNWGLHNKQASMVKVWQGEDKPSTVMIDGVNAQDGSIGINYHIPISMGTAYAQTRLFLSNIQVLDMAQDGIHVEKVEKIFLNNVHAETFATDRRANIFLSNGEKYAYATNVHLEAENNVQAASFDFENANGLVHAALANITVLTDKGPAIEGPIWRANQVVNALTSNPGNAKPHIYADQVCNARVLIKAGRGIGSPRSEYMQVVNARVDPLPLNEGEEMGGSAYLIRNDAVQIANSSAGQVHSWADYQSGKLLQDNVDDDTIHHKIT